MSYLTTTTAYEMRALILSLGLISLFCGGCMRRCGDMTLYQQSGRQKPIVAVLPVIDNTSKNDLKWDLSREMTDEIRKRVFESKRIYLLREGGNLEIAKLLSTPNPQAISKATATSLGATEFAVVAEIIEQEEEKYQVVSLLDMSKSTDAGSVLSLALRVRVIDVRQEKPKVILQEVLDNDYVISRAYMNCDYSKYPWGTEAFAHTPMGMAHNRLIRTLVSRIEAYIEAVK
jgi:hypothetical protein